MEHALVACAHSFGVYLMQGQLGYVVQLDEVGVTQHVILVF